VKRKEKNASYTKQQWISIWRPFFSHFNFFDSRGAGTGCPGPALCWRESPAFCRRRRGELACRPCDCSWALRSLLGTGSRASSTCSFPSLLKQKEAREHGISLTVHRYSLSGQRPSLRTRIRLDVRRRRPRSPSTLSPAL
jgi:hypothetical protein